MGLHNVQYHTFGDKQYRVRKVKYRHGKVRFKYTRLNPPRWYEMPTFRAVWRWVRRKS